MLQMLISNLGSICYFCAGYEGKALRVQHGRPLFQGALCSRGGGLTGIFSS